MKPQDDSPDRILRLHVKRYFITLLAREFGFKSKTVGIMTDPTTVQNGEGYILFNHPLIGHIHYRVKYHEAYGVETLRFQRTPLLNDEPMPDVFGDGDDQPYEKEIKQAEADFGDFEEHVLSACCSPEQREPFSKQLSELLGWLLADPDVKFGKKPFEAPVPDYDCIY